jgi:predicted outer membrane protein
MQNNNIAEQDFVNYAVPGNTKEIIWLKAGIAKSKNKEIKKHASMMLADHEKLDATVKTYLGNHSALSVPSVDTSNVVNINDKKGSAWDSAWTNKMVEDHGELLTKLENSQKNVKDTALLSIINSTIPIVESHLAMVKAVKVSGK